MPIKRMCPFVKKASTHGNERKNVYEKLDEMFERGITSLLMGVSPDRFLGKTSYLRSIMCSAMALLLVIYGGFEVVSPALFQCDFLTGLSHLYFGSCCLGIGCQWLLLLVNLKDIHENRMQIESFNSTQAIPEIAEAIVDRKLKVFTRSRSCLNIIWWSTVAIFGIGGLIQSSVQFFVTGEVGTIVTEIILPIPQWGQLIVGIVNVTIMILMVEPVVVMYTISGLLTLETVIQCEIICAAMVRDTSNKPLLRGYIVDHIQVVKNARWLINMLESVNSATTLGTYFAFAINMLILTLVEADGHFYVAMAIDFLGVFLQLGAQGWLSSSLTNALESVSRGSYETNWYQRDKSYALDVLIISNVAQRKYVQKVLLRTLPIERATVLDIVRGSYSLYTLLMIVQSKK